MILKGEHDRKAVVNQIATEFMKFTIQFFKDIVHAKLDDVPIDHNWYKKYFLGGRFSTKETAIYAGLNDKTIRNIYGSSAKKVVVNVAPEYYDELLEMVSNLIAEDNSDLEIELNIAYKDVSVKLTLSETLIVINTLGVKRSEIRGGAWSSIGKKLELPLMVTLAKLYQVPAENYAGKGLTTQGRDVDFHFMDVNGKEHYCEVKLMGKGNPESADAHIARDTTIFIADTLSTLNKTQLTQRGSYWVMLRDPQGYKRIYDIFTELNIPCTEFTGDLDTALDIIIPQVFDEI